MLYLQERGLSPPHCTQENHLSIILSINPEMTDARTCTATAFQSVFFFLLLFHLCNGDAPALPVKVLHKGLCQPIQRQQDCVVLPCDMEFIFICRSERGAFFSAQSEYSRMSAIASGVSKGYFITMNHKTSGSACCYAKQPPNRDGRTRTLDTLDISQLLYPTELRPRGFPAGVTVQRGLKYIRRSIQRSSVEAISYKPLAS